MAGYLLAAAAMVGCSTPREITPWVQQFGESGQAKLAGIAVAEDGAVALTGGFGGKTNFGGGDLGSSAGDDIFVAMLEDTGGPRWSGRTGSQGDDDGKAIAVAPNGDILIAGNFAGAISFGQGELNAKTSSVFVARFDPSGDLVWARALGDGIGTVYVSSIAVTPEGAAVIGGNFFKQTNFGGDTLTTMDFASFVAELDEDGEHVFSVGFGGTDNAVTSLTVDTTGSIVFTGRNNGSVQLGGASFDTSGAEAFAGKLDADGSPRWLVQMGSESFSDARSVATDAEGNVFVGGAFEGTFAFGTTNIPAAGSQDAYIAKLSSGGKPLWLKSFGAQYSQLDVRASAVDSNGHVAFTGQQYGNADFGGGTLFTHSSVAYLAELDGDGHHVSSRIFDSSDGYGESSGEAIGLDREGALLVGGNFSGGLVVPGKTLNSVSDRDIFLLRFKR